MPRNVIVVADCKSELQGGEHNSEALIDAVCGTTITTVSMPSGEVSEGRKSNGYFWTSGKAAHENVSAVILLPRPHLWDLREDRWQPLMVHHPFASHPLSEAFLDLPAYRHDGDQNLMIRHKGTMMADLLGLPVPWPPAGT